MKNLSRIFLFILFCVSSNTYAQSKSQKALRLALEYNYYFNYDSALYFFQPLLQNKKSKFYSAALYETAYAYYYKREDTNAERYLIEFLKSDPKKVFVFQDKIDIRFNADQAAMHHNAYDFLINIYIESGRFQTALDSMKHDCRLFVPEKELCYVGLSSNYNDRLIKLGKCYNGLHQYDSTIQLLWDHIFQYDMHDYSSVADQIIIALEQKYSQASLIKEVKDAEARIYFKKIGDDERAYIDLFGKALPLPRDHYFLGTHFYLDLEDFYKQKGMERERCIYTGSYFYRKITSIDEFKILNN